MTNILRVPVVCFATVLAAAAQSPTEYSTLRQLLQKIRDRAANSLTIVDSPTRPGNWTDTVVTDLTEVVVAATTVWQTAQASTVDSISVPAGGNLQAALNNANPGETIVLEAGATYTGPFTLPVKSGADYITITTSKLARLPAEGQRVTASDAGNMAKIIGQNGGPAIVAIPGAHHYRFSGIEIAAGSASHGALVQIGSGAETFEAALPHDIEFDRMYIHGDSSAGSVRGMQMNGKAITLKNSYLTDFRSGSYESTAVHAWNTPGPLTIVNNRIEASGFSIRIGGVDPRMPGVIPSDIMISNNYITRPLEWRDERLVMRSPLEFRAGRRIRVAANILEHAWTAYAINLRPAADARGLTVATDDVLIENNILRRAGGGISMSGLSVGASLSNVTIRNNLLDDIGPIWGAALPLFTLFLPASDMVIENNTATASVTPTWLVVTEGDPSRGFVFRNNIVPHGLHGFKGSGRPAGLETLRAFFVDAVFTNNVIFGATVDASAYPFGNYFPLSASQVGWANPAAGNYKLASASPYFQTGAGGGSPGVAYDLLTAATSAVVAGR